MPLSTALKSPFIRCLIIIFTVAGIRCRGAELPAPQAIVAGPFSVVAPARWADGVIVEKRAIYPLYTRSAWRKYQEIEEKRKVSPEIPSYGLKPGYVTRPTHWAIRFPKLLLPSVTGYDWAGAGGDGTAPQILIHKSAEWSAAYRDGTFDAVAAKKLTRILRAMVDNQDVTKSPVCMDAQLEFVVEKKKLRFAGGHGFRALAQWSIEPDLVRRGRLHYMFLGLSDDNSCQIVATFPVDIPGLPGEGSDAEHLGFSVKPYPEFSRQFRRYQQTAKEWLTANAGNINPSLTVLDAMMTSLVARKWE